jgi:hypothetical protein
LAHELGLVRLALPQNARQVPQAVFYQGLKFASFQFGFELGTGMRTLVSATAPYVVALAILLGFSSAYAAVTAGVGFGFGRASMVWLRFGASHKESWDELLTKRLLWIKPLSFVALAVAAGSLTLSAWV